MLSKARAPTPKSEISPSSVPVNGTLPPESGRSLDFGSHGADQRSNRRFKIVPLEQTAHPRTRLASSTASVLSTAEFARYFERERSLADRGTRRFSLLVLHRQRSPAGEANQAGRRGRDALAQLALHACQHLRSTDVVGLLDPSHVEILLTDTEPAGAQIVALLLEQVRVELGLELKQTIYVYPSVTEATSTGEPESGRQEDDPPSGVNGNGHHNGHVQGAPQLAPEKVKIANTVPWELADLWPRLGIPTPVWKRTMDVIVSSSLLVLMLPFFALIALAIRLDSAGPVIFRQQRAGRSGRAFAFFKFRSMIADAEAGRAALADHNEQDGPIFKIRADPRITTVGRWLRRWSIDELPQLWNVLKGDISLVGPRSPMFSEVCKYERWQRRRLCVTGGITCSWQVSGRSQIGFRDWMRLDMRYIGTRTFWVDLRLLVMTLPAVITGRGAC